jgi:hypothetical protein
MVQLTERNDPPDMGDGAMTDSNGYNGWTNYETWCVSLWLDNDAGTYDYVREQASVIDANNRGDDDARYELASWLKDYVEELAENTCPGVIEGASFVADMFRAALSEVDWSGVAANLLCELSAV